MSIVLAGIVNHGGGLVEDSQLTGECLHLEREHFKNLTMGHVLVLDTKRYLERQAKHSNAFNKIVLMSPDQNQVRLGDSVCVVDNVQKVVAMSGSARVIVNGGAYLYSRFINQPLVTVIYLTRVHTSAKAHEFFPVVRADSWEMRDYKSHPQIAFEMWIRK